jgi:hypothetical protein
MNLRSSVVVVLAAAVLGAGSLGCGVLSKAKQAVDNVKTVTDLADKLGKADDLTYTGKYRLISDGTTATVTQDPPKAAYIGKDGRYILTDDALFLCTGAAGRQTCQRSPKAQAGAPGDQAAMMSAVAGGGFISAPMAIALMTASAVVPGIKIGKSDRKVAGVDSTCLHVTGIPADSQPNSVTAKEYDVCVGDNGILTRFVGVGTDDKQLGVELTSFSKSADAKNFVAPAGAKIVDVQSIDPTQN